MFYQKLKQTSHRRGKILKGIMHSESKEYVHDQFKPYSQHWNNRLLRHPTMSLVNKEIDVELLI